MSADSDGGGDTPAKEISGEVETRRFKFVFWGSSQLTGPVSVSVSVSAFAFVSGAGSGSGPGSGPGTVSDSGTVPDSLAAALLLLWTGKRNHSASYGSKGSISIFLPKSRAVGGVCQRSQSVRDPRSLLPDSLSRSFHVRQGDRPGWGEGGSATPKPNQTKPNRKTK